MFSRITSWFKFCDLFVSSCPQAGSRAWDNTCKHLWSWMAHERAAVEGYKWAGGLVGGGGPRCLKASESALSHLMSALTKLLIGQQTKGSLMEVGGGICWWRRRQTDPTSPGQARVKTKRGRFYARFLRTKLSSLLLTGQKGDSFSKLGTFNRCVSVRDPRLFFFLLFFFFSTDIW